MKQTFKQFLLREMAYPEKFSFEEFNSIKSYAGKLKYANTHLIKLSSGSSRVAYKVDEEKVLKIAKNKKGLSQNYIESDWSMANYGVTARVFLHSEDNFWVEMELAKKLTPTRFKEIVGLSTGELDNAMRWLSSRRRPGHIIKPEPEEQTKIENNEFYQRIERFIVDYDFPTADFGRLSSYGEVIRDGKPAVVLIDFGCSNDVWKTHYAR